MTHSPQKRKTHPLWDFDLVDSDPYLVCDLVSQFNQIIDLMLDVMSHLLPQLMNTFYILRQCSELREFALNFLVLLTVFELV